MASPWEADGQEPFVSVVISTDGRARSLAATLESLRQVAYPHFEVCVVAGPTEDGTDAVLEGFAGRIRAARCPIRNLSVSRNIGIGMAAGEIVAFLDDDALPEPEWLRELLPAYADPTVGGAGGFVLDPEGIAYQYRFGTTDRLGAADLSWDRAAPELSFPFSANIPHLLGANSSFRRSALCEVGGFDEEFEYYLDETDLALRLTDAGWRLAQVAGAHVHHKFRASDLRNERRVLRSWYPVLKNKIYFALRHGESYFTKSATLAALQDFIKRFRRDRDWAVGQGLLAAAEAERFDEEVERAWQDGLRRGIPGEPRLADIAAVDPAQFQPFPTLSPAGTPRCLCLLSREYPPGPVGGVGRYVHLMARGIAALGHQVHVLTGSGAGADRINLEDGVWVHRLQPLDAPPPIEAPPHIWAHSAAMLAGVRRIAARRTVDAVIAPIWDVEGIATLESGEFRLVTSLQTSLHKWLESEPERAADPAFQRDFARPVLALERRLLRHSDAVHAISAAIGDDIAASHGLAPAMTADWQVVRLGAEDFSTLPAAPAPALPTGAIRLLFVGRLERRKGIDLLFAAATRLLTRLPHLHLDIVGNDRLPGPGGGTWRDTFDADRASEGVRDRVHFRGEVSEPELRGFYAACDLFVAPSRFESFGLIFLEAMTFGKPVVGCRVGGVPEVVEDGVTGLLAAPDAASLEACLAALLEDADRREAMGRAGRARYLANFAPERLAVGMLALVDRMIGARDERREAS